MSRLAGRTVLVTGATAGLGRALVARFWREGASIVAVGRSLERLAGCMEERHDGHEQTVQLVNADLSREADVEQLAVVLASPGIDVLVNNAAVQGPIGPLWENDLSDWRAALAVDLVAPVALCQAFARAPRTAHRRKIINVSGGGATGPRANFSAYATAKAGLARFSETLAVEAAALDIDVHCVAPGAMHSSMTDAILAAGAVRAGERECALARTAVAAGAGGMDAPLDLCVFLASAESDGITGRLLSAVWDPWQTLAERRDELCGTDIYTLRRIVPEDRGKAWPK